MIHDVDIFALLAEWIFWDLLDYIVHFADDECYTLPKIDELLAVSLVEYGMTLALCGLFVWEFFSALELSWV